MGRAFEFRKGRKMKRWSHMAKTFTRIGREIAMAVKESGPNPESNSRLRVLIQNAKGENMPKENIERAIKKATSKEQEDYKEMVYEGYGPYGIAIVVECATDNPIRTVANVRSYFTRSGGNLGTTGSLDFLFDRKCVFKIRAENLIVEELELELIDYGADEVFEEGENIIIYGTFTEFGAIQKFMEEKGLEVIQAGFERIPMDTKKTKPGS
jgi:YebC/PmpR family DNA-binding regulatory protein